MKFDYTKQPIPLDTQVWFVSQDDNGITINAGKIVGYVGEDLDRYRVLSNEEEFELEKGQLFTSESDVMSANNLRLFSLAGSCGFHSYYDELIAPNLESAIKIFKKKYPEASDIKEVSRFVYFN